MEQKHRHQITERQQLTFESTILRKICGLVCQSGVRLNYNHVLFKML